MRLFLLMSVSCLWAGASALSFGRANLSPDEDDNEGTLLRGRNLKGFFALLDYAIEAPNSEQMVTSLECKYNPETPDVPTGADYPSSKGKGNGKGSKGSKGGDDDDDDAPGSKGKGGSGEGKGSKGSKGGDDDDDGGKGGSAKTGKGGSGKGKGSKGGDEDDDGAPGSKGKGGSGKGQGSKGSKGGDDDDDDGPGSKGKGGSGKGKGSKGSKGGDDDDDGGPGIPEVPEECPCRPGDEYDDCYEGEVCCPDDSSEYGYICVPEEECFPQIPVPPTTAPEIPPPPTTTPEIPPPPTTAPVECPEIDCGELDEPCCVPGVDINVTDSTSKCFDGLVCNSPSPELGICIECGDLGEPCCEGNEGNDLCAVDLVCVDDDSSPTGKTCEVPPAIECPECPVCPTPGIPPEIPPTTFCIPTGQPCENFEECCDSDQCEPGGTCCNNAFNPCVNGTIFDNADVCCGERACVVPPDGEDVCCGLLGEGDDTSGCNISDDRCCGGLVCGVQVDAIVGTIPPGFPLPSESNTCCVPPLELIPTDIAEEFLPKCKPSYKSLNFLLEKINTGDNVLGFTIEDWNGCCDPNDLCNSLGECVNCIEVGDFGCTSTPEACCGGIMEDPAVDCAASGGPNTADGPYPEPSNRCCVKNGREGCEVTRVPVVDDTLCCQFENGFTCTENICCLPLYNEGRIGFQQDCFNNDDNCCGDLVCVNSRCASA